jgi:hypothetical protein
MSPEDSLYSDSLKADLEAVLQHLDERDAGVLRMRYGLLDGREYTLDEVGAKYQVRARAPSVRACTCARACVRACVCACACAGARCQVCTKRVVCARARAGGTAPCSLA